MKLLFMNRKFDGIVGGVERMSVALANEMVRRGHSVHFVSLDTKPPVMYFSVDPSIKMHYVATQDPDRRASFGERWKRLLKLRALMRREKFDAAMGFQDGAYLSLVTAAIGTGVPVIAAERNAPSRFDHMSSRKAKIVAFNSFRFARRITVQCESYRNEYPEFLRHKIAVIPNPVPPVGASPLPGNKKILFVGRLESQKNVKALIEAFRLAAPKRPGWTLDIVGDGSQRPSLERQAKEAGISERIIFHGAQRDVDRYYQSCDIFVMPSLFEGFPNAVAEAMGHGRPCAGFASCLGVRDLILDGVTGLLAQDGFSPESLADVLARLMDDADARASMGASGHEAVKAFAPPVIFDSWERVFKESFGKAAVR